MGLNASAELIWGIPVVAYDDESYMHTDFWDEDKQDWIELPSPLFIEHFGHYEDSQQRGILTSKLVKRYWGDCWNQTEVPDRLAVSDEVREACNAAAREAGLDVNFYNACWCLVASFG